MYQRHLHSPIVRWLTFIAAVAVFALTAIGAPRCYRASPTSAPIHLEPTYLAPDITDAPPSLPKPRANAARESSRIPTSGVTRRCTVPVSRAGRWARPIIPPEPSREERSRTLRTIALVAREMGASPRTASVIQHWAVRESDLRFSIHIKPKDVRAASSPGARARIAAMGREYGPEWSYGRGLYGMQPSYFMRRWHASVPLDVLCDPVGSTVTAIWAARDHARACERQGYPATILVATRRWAAGHCGTRAKDADTRRYWTARGVNADTVAVRWGNRYPQSDGVSVLTAMRAKVTAAGLDAAQPLG